MTGKVLILGADGFIGRHIAFHLRAEGWDVVASARRTTRLARMGFACFTADLADPQTHDPAFWAGVATGRKIVNAAGLLTASDARFEAVHVKAPAAAYANADGGVLISAVGIEADTPFARWRRAGEDVAAAAKITILRPGLVMADTSYGGTSLLRALAALPAVTPMVGQGDQVFNPIHAEDLARVVGECLDAPKPGQPYDIGGPTRITQADLLRDLRGWLGLPPARALPMSPAVARIGGAVGDALNLGPISRTAVAQIEQGVETAEAPLVDQLTAKPRGIEQFLTHRPAGTQDLWHARLFLLRPLIRLTLALLWIASGLLGLFLPAETFLPMTAHLDLPDALWIALARGGGLADLAIALALIRNWRPRLTGLAQLALVGAYTLAFTLLAPFLWLLPLGGLLKNLPILVLIVTWMVLEDER
ncbi:DoxX-like family protein [Hasllibacter sp. MH4015]|uniref:DoxX-like family protein n=1 Tax=Hasllibacter sp. MH4015 TaxID=2854029 RepID=UPI001CD4BBEC|nr:DoxX-like family protein [Hasllibacter sp. MH4015]